MKKLKFIYTMLIVVFVTLCLASCRHKSGPQSSDKPGVVITQEDIAYVQACIDEINNERYKSVDDFVSSMMVKNYDMHIDSVICSIPTRKLEQISTAVYSKYGYITKEMIAKEYDEYYQQVYKYIPVDMSESENTVPDTTINNNNKQ